jgi:hypothetical protein
MGLNNKNQKKLQNKTVDNLYISYDFDDRQNNEICRECETLGKIAECGFQNPRTWEM